jgi:cytochrome o ubiquinol oxidase subunit II
MGKLTSCGPSSEDKESRRPRAEDGAINRSRAREWIKAKHFRWFFLKPNRAPQSCGAWMKATQAAAQQRLRSGWSVLGVPCRTLFTLPLLGGCSRSKHLTFLDPQGPIAAIQRIHLFEIFLLVMIVVLPVLVLTPLFAWRYRYSNESTRYTPNWSFSWPLEIAIWGVPFGIVSVLAVLLWQDTQALDPYAPISSARPPLHVQVVGYDWKWLFIYPDLGIASIGQFAFPADRPLAIDLTSDTVMQSFFIPALGSQIYAMAGMITKLHLKASTAGDFLGENTQYNGDGFQQQDFTAVAMMPDAFNAWTVSVKAKGIPMTPVTYDAIRQRSTVNETREALRADHAPNGVLYFSDVSSSLFQNIVHSFHGGAAGVVELSGGTTSAAKSE